MTSTASAPHAHCGSGVKRLIVWFLPFDNCTDSRGHGATSTLARARPTAHQRFVVFLNEINVDTAATTNGGWSYDKWRRPAQPASG
jgi:hypothetical protein